MMVMTMMVVMMMMIDDDDNYDEYDADFYCQVMVWSVGTGRPVRDIDAIRDIEYGSLSLLLLDIIIIINKVGFVSLHRPVELPGQLGRDSRHPGPQHRCR